MIFDPFWDDFWPVLGWFLTHFWTPHFWGVLDPHFGPGVVPPYHPPLGGQKTSQKGEKWGPLEGGVPPPTWVPPLLFGKSVKSRKMPYKSPFIFGVVSVLTLFSIVLTPFWGGGGPKWPFWDDFWPILGWFWTHFWPPPGLSGVDSFLSLLRSFSCFEDEIFIG